MQQFQVTLLVTVNTASTVSEAEVAEAVKDCLEAYDGDNGFPYGTAEVKRVIEV